MQLDDVLGGRSNNPRKGKGDLQQLQHIEEESKKKGKVVISPTSEAGGNQLSIDNMAKFK
jgi:hypothetical protein